MKALTHRDQIHGDVRFDPLAVALLNTETLQRLGRVYQLGFAHLVYRGGTHTRLSHVMGASHVAGELVELLRQNYNEGEEPPFGAVFPDDFLPVGLAASAKEKPSIDIRWDVLKYLVRWAALLHDVGHIPLGHTLEDEFDGIYLKHDDFASPRIRFLWHEISIGKESEIHRVFNRKDLLPASFGTLGVTGEQAWQAVMLICLHKENKEEGLSFGALLEKQEESKTPFVRILKEAYKKTVNKIFFPYMADIVGNTICADYLDYLRRDPSNVGLDVLRDDRVASRFFVGRDSSGSFRMALALVDRRGKPRLDTCTGAVELVRQRFRFAEIIYYHKTKVAASAMLARAFALIGKPPEIPTGRSVIDIDQIESLAEEVASKGLKYVNELRKQSSPSSLLDSEVGDESLLWWLQQQAWDRLEATAGSKEPGRVIPFLSAISLLQALTRRQLYKVCLTLDKNGYQELSPGSKQDAEIELSIQKTLDQLRNNSANRTNLESQMAAAAGWPLDSLLLYIPPRKSQAKGIETGALDRGDVVTLGTHSAVREEVSRLNEAYRKLWRIILLVHPKYEENVIGLSKAVDALVLGIWPQLDKSEAVEAIRKAAWFRYIPEKQRAAAAKYHDLVAPAKPKWSEFDVAANDTTDGTVSTDEHAFRAALLAEVSSRGGSAVTIRTKFSAPGSLSQAILELAPKITVEGRDAIQDKTRAIIEHIANELIPESTGKTQSLFKAASE